MYLLEDHTKMAVFIRARDVEAAISSTASASTPIASASDSTVATSPVVLR